MLCLAVVLVAVVVAVAITVTDALPRDMAVDMVEVAAMIDMIEATIVVDMIVEAGKTIEYFNKSKKICLPSRSFRSQKFGYRFIKMTIRMILSGIF